jgi:hypothetical protein
MEDIKKQILKLCNDFKIDCIYWDHNRLTHEENSLRNYPAPWIQKTNEILKLMGAKTVVEIGSTRYAIVPKCIEYYKDSYRMKPCEAPACCQDGHSTYFWANEGYETYTVDIDEKCKDNLINQYNNHLHIQVPENLKICIPQDGIEFLKNFNKPIDFLFLDGWNVGEHRYAEFHLEAFQAAQNKLAPLHLISVDDCDFKTSEGGKDKLLTPFLLDNGYIKILWGRQNLFLNGF